MSRNYVMIGFMGSGKTTVSRYLSTHYGFTLRDTDSMIELATGKTIGLIFREDGEEAFRDAETALLTRMCQESGGESMEEGSEAPGTIISTGGGIILRKENRDLLRQIGEVIYLRIQPETVLKRLRRDRKRPLLQGSDREKKVPIRIEAAVFAGRPAEASFTAGGRTVRVTGDPVSAAKSQPLDEAKIRANMSKTGETDFEAVSVRVRTDGCSFLPVKSLNELRRAGVGALRDALTAEWRRLPGTEAEENARQPAEETGNGETAPSEAVQKSRPVRSLSQRRLCFPFRSPLPVFHRAAYPALGNPDSLKDRQSVPLPQGINCKNDQRLFAARPPQRRR